MKIGEEKAGHRREKRCRIVVVASRNCIIRAPSERDFELLMNEYNAFPPLPRYFSPQRQWNSNANSIGRTNYPFIIGIGNETSDLVELLFEPRKTEEEISRGGEEKDDLTRVPRFKTRDEFARIFATFLSAKRAAFLSSVMVFEKFRKENSRLFKYIID